MDLISDTAEVIRLADHRRQLADDAAADRAKRLGYCNVVAAALGRAARIALGPHEDPEHCARRVVRVPRRSATTGDVA